MWLSPFVCNFWFLLKQKGSYIIKHHNRVIFINIQNKYKLISIQYISKNSVELFDMQRLVFINFIYKIIFFVVLIK